MASFLSNGLLGMGGLGGLGGNTMPAGLLKGDLAALFNPASMRNQQLKQGLLSAGMAMMNPDPHAPPSNFGGVLGRAAAGGFQGANQAKQDFYQDGMMNVQLMEMQRQQDERTKQKEHLDSLMQYLSPEEQSWARAYPEKFAEAAMKAQFGGSGDEYGINPIWTQGLDGKYRLFQSSKGGKAPREMQFPEGVSPSPPVTFQDLGTSIVPYSSKGGAPAGQPVQKDLAGAEKQKVLGKGEGEATIDYKSISSKMPGLEHVVSELGELAKSATYTSTGQLVDFVIRETGQEPRESAVARARYIAIVDNQILPMLRDTFGAQFTQREGESLKVTLGDPNKSPAEKQAVLEAFIEQKRRNIEDAATMAGQRPDASAAQPTRLRYNPATGELE